MTEEYRQCTLSVMDTIADPNITFDEDGVCSYYHDYQRLAEKELIADSAAREASLNRTIDRIKLESRTKKYDCVLGVSGGVDSTYLALLAKKFDLRVLAVHFDNGWNSELAVHNIHNLCDKLGFELSTYVVDWEEFKDLQLSYLKASVVDIEAITDHGIGAAVLKTADKHGIKSILSGTNIVTEAILPSHWIYNKGDAVNIKDIHRQFGRVPLKSFPICGTKQRKYYRFKGIESIKLLNLVDYQKEDAKQTIAKDLNWRDYGGKHYESIFTRFYQGYILPTKFLIDKRKAHLSNLVFSGQLTRKQALEELSKPIYPESTFEMDKEFVLKKLALSSEEFDQIMKEPRREHTEFAVEQSIFAKYPLIKPLQPLWRKIT